MTRRRQDNWEGEGSLSRALREDEAVMMELTTWLLRYMSVGSGPWREADDVETSVQPCLWTPIPWCLV